MTQPTTLAPPTTVTDTPPPPGWPAAWGMTPPPPPVKRKIGRYIVGGVAVLFIIGLASGGDKKTTSSSGGVIATTATTATTPATTPATTAGTSKAAGSMSMATWANRYGSSDSEQIGDDLNALQADAEAMDISGMGVSCRTLQRHVATAKSHLPTPDTQLTSALQSAYGYYDRAMTACISGTANMDVDKLTEMTSYITLATGSISEATARLDVLS